MRMHTKGNLKKKIYWLTTSEEDTWSLMMDSALLVTDTRKQAFDSTGQSRIVKIRLDNGHEDPL